MVTNYYNSSNNFSSPIRQKEPAPHSEMRCEEIAVKNEICPESVAKNNDKILLLGILAILYFTECDDVWLLLALVYLAVS